jgi:hypothetical protein
MAANEAMAIAAVMARRRLRPLAVRGDRESHYDIHAAAGELTERGMRNEHHLSSRSGRRT